MDGVKFEHLGFFVEYMVGSKLIGCKKVKKNDRGCTGYASTRNHIADEVITFKYSKNKIKPGQAYKTRIYPLCGKVIK